MCNYQLLVKNKNGYIIRCASCKRFKLVFGTIAVNLEMDDLEMMLRAIRFECKNCSQEHSRSTKNFNINLDNRVSIIMTHYEIEALKEMIETAINLVDLYSVLEISEEHEED